MRPETLESAAYVVGGSASGAALSGAIAAIVSTSEMAISPFAPILVLIGALVGAGLGVLASFKVSRPEKVPQPEKEARAFVSERPFGVTVLTILAALAAVLAGVRTLQYLGIIPFTLDFFIGEFSFRTFNLWAALMWGLLTWIYIWLVRMLWNVQKEAWLFLAVITVFNLILDFIVLVGGGTVEDMGASFLLNALILIYTMLPGTRQAFDLERSHSPVVASEPPTES